MNMTPRDPATEPTADRELRLPAGLEAGNLVDQLPAILYIADVGIGGRWHYVSLGISAILGFTPEEWMEDPGMWARQMHPDDRSHIFEREDELDRPGEPDEYRLRHRNGTIVWVRDDAALLPDAEGNIRWHGVMLDITDRKLAEAELERRAEQQSAVARLGKYALEGEDVNKLMRSALEEATRIIGVESGAVFEMTRGYGSLLLRTSVGPMRPPGLLQRRTSVDGAERRPARAADARNGNGGDVPYLPYELCDGWMVHIEGRDRRWGALWLANTEDCELAPADLDFVQTLANILADAIQQRTTEDDIRYQALHDPLTGLPNRVLFLDRLDRTLARRGAEVAVVLLDIDNFKLVNDSLGHSAGDELLMAVAPRLTAALRPEDTIARLGGDEFVVLVEQIPDERAAAQVAQRIMAAFEEPFELTAGEHFAKASLGIAVASRAGSTPSALFGDADAALYQAKRRGRGRFEIFDSAMRARTVERLSLENDLRRALEREELHVVYQPIVSLSDGSICSVEALLRWEHPERGLISPVEFIPVAEESGMIEPIGRWVLETACTRAARWRGARQGSKELGISVNLSVRQLMQRDLQATIEGALNVSGLEPSRLSLEITESVLLEEPEGVSATITRIAELGVRFVLDDFGTGYSSLAYLSGLPINGLKVDRSFVTDLGSDERSTAITTAIVRMAQALAVDVIAEGVETECQATALRELECELAQGFHFHRPLDHETLSRILAEERPAPSAPAPPGPAPPDLSRRPARCSQTRGSAAAAARASAGVERDQRRAARRELQREHPRSHRHHRRARPEGAVRGDGASTQQHPAGGALGGRGEPQHRRRACA